MFYLMLLKSKFALLIKLRETRTLIKAGNNIKCFLCHLEYYYCYEIKTCIET